MWKLKSFNACFKKNRKFPNPFKLLNVFKSNNQYESINCWKYQIQNHCMKQQSWRTCYYDGHDLVTPLVNSCRQLVNLRVLALATFICSELTWQVYWGLVRASLNPDFFCHSMKNIIIIIAKSICHWSSVSEM